jgi:hypothetical protein
MHKRVKNEEIIFDNFPIANCIFFYSNLTSCANYRKVACTLHVQTLYIYEMPLHYQYSAFIVCESNSCKCEEEFNYKGTPLLRPQGGTLRVDRATIFNIKRDSFWLGLA